MASQVDQRLSEHAIALGKAENQIESMGKAISSCQDAHAEKFRDFGEKISKIEIKQEKTEDKLEVLITNVNVIARDVVHFTEFKRSVMGGLWVIASAMIIGILSFIGTKVYSLIVKNDQAQPPPKVASTAEAKNLQDLEKKIDEIIKKMQLTSSSPKNGAP